MPPSGVPPDQWSDIIVVAATVAGEAEGEPMLGKIAVAFSPVNRAADPRWPDTPTRCALQRLQYSAWNEGSPRLAVMYNPRAHMTERNWEDCFIAAMIAVFGLERDPSMGSCHYHERSIMPNWAQGRMPIVTINRHCFYVDIP